jgi:NAD(P)H-hydrate epimerase
MVSMRVRPLSREEVRQIDRLAIQEFGVPGVVLMENAGRGTAALLRELGASGPVVICCGKGNNGGDGLVVARHLDAWGVPVHVILTCHPSELSGDAAVNFAIVNRASISWSGPDPELSTAETDEWLRRADWIVDGLLGTGTTGTVRDPMKRAIERINAAPAKRLAIDLPSGLDCDTGEVLGAAVMAHHTATFVALKKGFLSPKAQPYVGHVYVLDIGVPRIVLEPYLEKTD